MARYNPDLWPACWILSLIAQDKLHDFYVSKCWKRLSKTVRKNQKCRCWDCMHKRPAVIRCGVTVHHVNPVRERPDLALSEYDETGAVNLICLCASCHWDRHHKRNQMRVKIPERW